MRHCGSAADPPRSQVYEGEMEIGLVFIPTSVGSFISVTGLTEERTLPREGTIWGCILEGPTLISALREHLPRP
jgi:hypothetical protein